MSTTIERWEAEGVIRCAAGPDGLERAVARPARTLSSNRMLRQEQPAALGDRPLAAEEACALQIQVFGVVRVARSRVDV
jgi:hypothetical protein